MYWSMVACCWPKLGSADICEREGREMFVPAAAVAKVVEAERENAGTWGWLEVG